MNEIELKIPLTEPEYDRLFNELYGNTCTIAGITRSSWSNDEIFKQDENYTRYTTREEQKANNEPGVIRIRTQTAAGCEKTYFTIKRKTIENGIEVNNENETYVENADVIRDLLQEAGYHCWFKKEKRGYSCYCTLKNYEGIDFHVELEKVNLLPYIEIEVTMDNPDGEAVKNGLEELVRLLGLDINKRDSRSWRKIILDAQKMGDKMKDYEEHDIKMTVDNDIIIDETDFEEKFFERTQAGENAQKFASISSMRDCAILRSILNSEGIPSYVENECMNNIYGGLSGTMNAVVAIRLYIPCNDYDKAFEITMDFIKNKVERLETTKKGVRERILETIGILIGTPRTFSNAQEFLGITVFPKIQK